MHTLHLPFAFFTNTISANHSKYITSLMKPILMSLFTSSLVTSYLFSIKLLFFCLISLAYSLTLRLCIITFGLIPFIYMTLYTITLWLFLKNSFTLFLISSLNWDPIQVVLPFLIYANLHCAFGWLDLMLILFRSMVRANSKSFLGFDLPSYYRKIAFSCHSQSLRTSPTLESVRNFMTKW